MLAVGSLFSGIGGIELGLEWTGYFETKWQVEIDKYARKVLDKHWPDVPKYGDITKLKGKDLEYVDLICGGFPCQDISCAGKGAGITGERSGLFYEAMRLVREIRPRYVLLENVAALLGRGMGDVLAEIHKSGYNAEWDCIPAGAVGAHFLRKRVFIFATRAKSCIGRLQRHRPQPIGTWSEQQFERLLRHQLQLAIPAGSHGRISDGVPKRVDRIKCLGNAVVPQVAQFIGECIKEFDQIGS